MDELITSRDNRQVKLLSALLEQKKYREETGLFAAEGVRLCLDAVEGSLVPHTLLLTPEAREKYPRTTEIADRAQKTVLISGELAGRIGDTKTPQGVFCIFPKVQHEADVLPVKKEGKYLLLAGLQDPGNLGTILRTAACLGVDGACLAGCPDLYAPKVLRAAMGALWRLSLALWDNPQAMVAWMQEQGIAVYGAALTAGAVPLGAFSLAGGSAVLIGNEGSGLPAELVDACDRKVIIPMSGGADSLNAASAAAILLWELVKAD